MPNQPQLWYEVLAATAGTPPAWHVKVTKAKRVQSASVIPLGDSGGGVNALANQAGAVTVGSDGQTLNFNNNAGGTVQPSSMSVLAIYEGT